jgi:glycerol dehydrogenase-like iron-containing ADH family enzyme
MNTIKLLLPNIIVINDEIEINIFLKQYDIQNTLFVVTPSSQVNINFTPEFGTIVEGLSFIKEDLDKQLDEMKNLRRIVVVGASKKIDQAKYLAAKLTIPLIVIPSILSTNAFSTDKAVLKVNSKSTSIDAKVPDEVYVINSLLSVAPEKYNKFGLLDVLSIYTAVTDWDIAINKEQSQITVEYYLAKAILSAFLSIYSKLGNNYYDITKLLLHSGLVVSMYGDGRPESGSEHIIAKAIESKIDCFHAHSVSFGILVIMKLQNSWNNEIANLAKEIPDWESQNGKNILDQINSKISHEDIKARKGRYTILDETSDININIAIKDVYEFLKV